MKSSNLFVSAIFSYDVWLHLAWQDIKLRYRLSKIGPLWITLSMGVFCLSLGIIYSQIFNSNTEEYIPYISIGIVSWNLIAGSLNDFPNVYVQYAPYMKEIKINPIVIILRVLFRHLIVFLHNFLIILFVFAYFKLNPGIVSLLVLPALILIVANLFMAGVILSILGARFRDLSQMTQSIVQLFFFVTPIIWHVRLIPEDSAILRFNPFSYLIDLMRSPLLGQVPALESWMVAIGLFVLSTLFASRLLASKGRRLAFWV